MIPPSAQGRRQQDSGATRGELSRAWGDWGTSDPAAGPAAPDTPRTMTALNVARRMSPSPIVRFGELRHRPQLHAHEVQRDTR